MQSSLRWASGRDVWVLRGGLWVRVPPWADFVVCVCGCVVRRLSVRVRYAAPWPLETSVRVVTSHLFLVRGALPSALAAPVRVTVCACVCVLVCAVCVYVCVWVCTCVKVCAAAAS